MADLQYMIPIVGVVAVFGYAAVEVWVKSRLKEREEFYRNETLRRFSESNQPDMLARFLAEEKAARQEMMVQQRERLRLGGLVTMVAGIGLGVMLAGIAPRYSFYLFDLVPFSLFGLVPFLVGGAILIYVHLLAPKLPASE